MQTNKILLHKDSMIRDLFGIISW